MAEGLPVLRGARLSLRAVRPDDLDALVALVAQPGVREWFGPAEVGEHLRAGLLNGGRAFVVEVGGERAGWLAFREEADPDYRHVGLDLALAPAFQGRGLGPEALRLVVDWLAADRGHHRFTVDPAARNDRAIRAYAAVGFRPVGLLRRYERGQDGTWHDGLLMDLLADERR